MTQTIYLDLAFMSRRDAYYLFYKNYPRVSSTGEPIYPAQLLDRFQGRGTVSKTVILDM